MRIAVAGATGNIGTLTVAALERAGHEVVRHQPQAGRGRRHRRGAGRGAGRRRGRGRRHQRPGRLAGARPWRGSAPPPRTCSPPRRGPVSGTTCCCRSSASTASRATPTTPASASRSAWCQAGTVPWTIVPATQFHDFAGMVAGWSAQDGVATVAPLLVQPIAPADVAAMLPRSSSANRRDATSTSPDRTAGPRRHGSPDA